MNSYLFDFFFIVTKRRRFQLSLKFTEFIDNLVNLNYNPSMNLSQKGEGNMETRQQWGTRAGFIFAAMVPLLD